MPPTHAKQLQTHMYGLYRQYYRMSRVTFLRAADFAHGTLRIKTPGLYVLAEDVAFDPDPHYLTTETFADPAYSMGYFAAVAVECDGVIFDLQGHTLRQSFSHYFDQRFFSIFELASGGFVQGQGPASVKATSLTVSANDCMILNGVVGLSSHSGIHGNNNRNVLLQNLVVRDFEVVGVQLNGVHNAFVDRVVAIGIPCAPLASETFSLRLHVGALRELAGEEEGGEGEGSGEGGGEGGEGGEITATADALAAMVEQLRAPFVEADAASATFAASATEAALREIFAKLQAAAPAGSALARYVTATGLPDGSAIYGVLIHATGVAINTLSDQPELSSVCANNGGGCPHFRYSGEEAGSNAHRESFEVALNDVQVRNLRLRSVEFVSLRRNGKLVRDITGAVLGVAQMQPGPGTLEFARSFFVQNDPDLKRLLRGELTLQQLVDADGDQTTTSFAYNADVMAHVSKGTFGLRIEDARRVCLESVLTSSLSNTSHVTHPTEHVPAGATLVSLNTMSPDFPSTFAFAGCDTRAAFFGNCHQLHVYRLHASDVRSTLGVTHGCEIDSSTKVLLHTMLAERLYGRRIRATILQHACVDLKLSGLTARNMERASSEDDADENDWLDLPDEAARCLALMRTTRYAARADPTTLTNESIPNVHQLTL